MAHAIGYEINEFYNNHWVGEDYFHDDYAYYLNAFFNEDTGKLELDESQYYYLGDFGLISFSEGSESLTQIRIKNNL